MLKRGTLAVGLIIVAIAAVQGGSIRYGLLLDDFNQRAQLKDGDWSFHSLVEAAHLGGHGRRVEMWWQQDADQHFFRPLAFFLMRAEYVLGSWRPQVVHCGSLALSVICASLVILFARSMLGSLKWATLAGLLFALHPANFLTVRWIACQNEQMATAFILGGLWLYGRYSGWFARTVPALREGGVFYLVGAIICFIAALGCRENSVVFTALVFLGDGVCRPRRWQHRWWIYALLAALTAAYLALRYHVLGGFPVPGRPYAYPPGEPGFVRFAVEKIVYYVLGLFAYFPIIGFSGQEELGRHPLLFFGTFTAILLGWVGVLCWFRQNRWIWLWLGVAIIPLAPVLPVFASSHHLYLPSAGMAIAVVAAWKWISDRAAARAGAARILKWGVAALATAHVLFFLGANVLYDAGVAGFHAASQITVNEAAQFGDPMKPGDRLFFINLPMLAFNCLPGIEEKTGAAPLHAYVLTFAPAFLGMDRNGYVERVGDRQLRVRLDDEGYFAGLLGQSMLQAIHREHPFAVGESFSTPDFDVLVERGSAAGISDLLFTFRRPLDDPVYHFFFGSEMFHAYPLRFTPVR